MWSRQPTHSSLPSAEEPPQTALRTSALTDGGKVVNSFKKDTDFGGMIDVQPAIHQPFSAVSCSGS